MSRAVLLLLGRLGSRQVRLAALYLTWTILLSLVARAVHRVTITTVAAAAAVPVAIELPVVLVSLLGLLTPLLLVPVAPLVDLGMLLRSPRSHLPEADAAARPEGTAMLVVLAVAAAGVCLRRAALETQAASLQWRGMPAGQAARPGAAALPITAGVAAVAV